MGTALVVAERLEYSSNNSGGEWWLTHKDWKAMDDHGWTVEWGGMWFCGSGMNMSTAGDPTYPFEPCADGKCTGHPRHLNYEEAVDACERGDCFLDAVATAAYIITTNSEQTIREWEDYTGQNAEDSGCDCCGPPHNFD